MGTLTVEELIEILSKYDKQTEVYFVNEDTVAAIKGAGIDKDGDLNLF